jgi:hypothetical protein
MGETQMNLGNELSTLGARGTGDGASRRGGIGLSAGTAGADARARAAAVGGGA